MSGSSDKKINYNLRPSKSIERKMILEVLKDVCISSEAKNYRYIGFGSSFFTDFKLFHKSLNICDMISIESKISNSQRVEYNKPYSCIDVKLGLSTQILPQLKWDKKSIVWLDYETSLRQYMFDDIATCTSRSLPGSFLILTLRREFEDGVTKEYFESTFGENVFAGFKNEDLEPSKSAETISRMFFNKIEDSLNSRNAAYKEPQKRVLFRQLFDFSYKDDAKMYTFGGMFIRGDEEQIFNNYNFNSLEFIGKKQKPHDISFPIITNKEYHELNALLPSTKELFLGKENIKFIPKEHVESYYNTYKFYPAYIEISDM